MKRISIVALSVLLAACSTGEYITDVTTDSYKEEYKPQTVSEPVMDKAVSETDVAMEVAPAKAENVQQVMKPQPVAVAEKREVMRVQSGAVNQSQPARSSNKMIRILPPTDQQKSEFKRFGYTIQVMAVGSSAKALSYANQLPEGRPVWEHYKNVKGTDWYAVLYGDYATKSEAKAAISTLPKYFRDLKPFVKSLDEIKNSDYPKLIKLR